MDGRASNGVLRQWRHRRTVFWTTTPPPPLGRKPRVALLHGTAGNEKVFGIQLMALMQKLKPAAESISTIEGRQVIAKDNPQAASILIALATIKYFASTPPLLSRRITGGIILR